MHRRIFSINRWNWSQKAEKWVYIKLTKEGKRKYHYQVEPPPEFIDLSEKMKNLNEKLLTTTDPEKNSKIFNELMDLSHKMQEMGKPD